MTFFSITSGDRVEFVSGFDDDDNEVLSTDTFIRLLDGVLYTKGGAAFHCHWLRNILPAQEAV